MNLDLIKKQRKVLSLTQAELANLAKVSVPSIQLFERGEGNPSLETLGRLGKILGLTVCIEAKKPDWSILVRAGAPLSGVAQCPRAIKTSDVIREFHLAWGARLDERERLALRALLLAYKLHYPSIYTQFFESQGVIIDDSEIDGRLLKLSRMAKATLGAE